MKSNATSSSSARLNGMYFFHAPKERVVSRREGESAVLLVMLGGVYKARWGSNVIVARSGDIVCWRKGDIRTEENDPGNPTRCLVLNFRWQEQQADMPRVARDAAGLMRMLALRLFAMTKDPVAPPLETWNAYLRALLAEYGRMGRHRTRSLLDKVNQCIEEHLSEPFTLKDLARWVGLERHHMGQRFKREHGMSPMRYVRGQRVQHALGYLATSPVWTLRRIATRVGVMDEVHLRRLIRQYTGLGVRDLRLKVPRTELLPFAQSVTRWGTDV